MRALLTAVLAISITGPAVAQTQRTYSSAYTTFRTLQSGWATSSLSPCRSGLNPTSPCYSGTNFPSYSATAIAVPTPTLGPETPKVSPLGADKVDATKAKSLIEEKGYLAISELKQDSRKIWRGNALTKNGRPVRVILDLKGNIFSEPKG